MRTIDAPPAQGLRRDLALAWRIGGMLLQYFLVGGRLRREYRRREARGDVYWVDGALGTPHRDDGLRGR